MTNDYIRGGQVAKNEIVMFWQNVKMVFVPIFTAVGVLSVIVFLNITEKYERYLWWKHIHAEVHLESMGNKILVEFVYPNGVLGKVYASSILDSTNVINAYNHITWLISFFLIGSVILTLSLFLMITVFLKGKGKKLAEEKVIDGVMPVKSSDELIKKIEIENKKINCIPRYEVAGVPFYDNSENLHLGVSGNVGQGKTQVLIPLVEKIESNNDKAIIYDKPRAFTKLFFCEQRDVILNPMDARSAPWNIHAEAKNATDYDSIFEAMIPLPQNTEPYWTLAARTIASKTALRFRQTGEYRMRPFLEKLYTTSLEDMANLLQGTEAASIIDKNNPKTGESIRSIMSTYIKCLGYCYDSPVYDEQSNTQDLSRLFSISQWVRDDDKKGFVFITTQGDQEATLKPLITTFFNIAVNAGMSMEASHERRIFVMLDELPALNKLPSITAGAAELRQFGFCFVGGWQLYSQLEEVYGVTGAKSIAGLLTTRIQFNAGAEESNVKHAAQQFGTYTVRIPDESLSIGVGAYRDGANFKFKDEKRDVVTVGDISSLPKLNGYIRMAGGQFPVAPFTHEYYMPEAKSVGMVERPLEQLAMGSYLIIGDNQYESPVPELPPQESDETEEDNGTSDSDQERPPLPEPDKRQLGQLVKDEFTPKKPPLDKEGLFDPQKAEAEYKAAEVKRAEKDIDLDQEMDFF
jgi:type IV conjugative transfer system coupling protein TraD